MVFNPSALMRKLFFSLLLVFSFLDAISQQSKQYSFKHFSVTNGLSSNSVDRVVQDKDGYIWMATSNGLQRYDGSSFITLKSSAGNPSSVPSNHIVLLYQDSKKNMWLMGDNNRIGIFDTRKFVFKDVPITGQEMNLHIVQGFSELHNRYLALLKDDGVHLKYDSSEKKFV